MTQQKGDKSERFFVEDVMVMTSLILLMRTLDERCYLFNATVPIFNAHSESFRVEKCRKSSAVANKNEKKSDYMSKT